VVAVVAVGVGAAAGWAIVRHPPEARRDDHRTAHERGVQDDPHGPNPIHVAQTQGVPTAAVAAPRKRHSERKRSIAAAAAALAFHSHTHPQPLMGERRRTETTQAPAPIRQPPDGIRIDALGGERPAGGQSPAAAAATGRSAGRSGAGEAAAAAWTAWEGPFRCRARQPRVTCPPRRVAERRGVSAARRRGPRAVRDCARDPARTRTSAAPAWMAGAQPTRSGRGEEAAAAPLRHCHERPSGSAHDGHRRHRPPSMGTRPHGGYDARVALWVGPKASHPCSSATKGEYDCTAPLARKTDRRPCARRELQRATCRRMESTTTSVCNGKWARGSNLGDGSAPQSRSPKRPAHSRRTAKEVVERGDLPPRGKRNEKRAVAEDAPPQQAGTQKEHGCTDDGEGGVLGRGGEPWRRGWGVAVAEGSRTPKRGGAKPAAWEGRSDGGDTECASRQPQRPSSSADGG